MFRKGLLMVLLLSISLMAIPFVQALTITSCTFDKDTYNQGEAGYVQVTIYNDENDKIRITELTAAINYYNIDGDDYYQRFYTDETLPTEISQAQSRTFHIPFSLPTYIASGYTDVNVRVETELWDRDQWRGSDNPRYETTFYIESPYKAQLEEQLAINKNTTNIMYLLGFIMVVFAAVTVFLFVLNRRARVVTQPVTR